MRSANGSVTSTTVDAEVSSVDFGTSNVHNDTVVDCSANNSVCLLMSPTGRRLTLPGTTATVGGSVIS